MAKAVKLADIAARVGVSTVTVSKALSNQKGVSEELRERIKVLADEMGYKLPSERKTVSSVNKSYNFGILISERFLTEYESFYWQLYQELTTNAVKSNCFTMLEALTIEAEEQRQMPRLLKERKVDGMFVVGRMSNEYLKDLSEYSTVPIVNVDYNNHKLEDSVISEGFYGMYQLVNYLLEKGHTKIGFVGTVGATSSITDRYLGYVKALLEHDIPLRREWIVPDRDELGGTVNVQMPDGIEYPTAFACNCDFTAGVVVKKLREKGYRVPEDISVVGFDNFIYPNMLDIGLTTYAVNIKGMAKMSVKIMKKKICEPGYKEGIHIVTGKVIERDSVMSVEA